MINGTESVNAVGTQALNDSANVKTVGRPAGIAPVTLPSSNVFVTEHGYQIKLPRQNIGGPKVTIQRIAPNQYLVVSKQTIYNAIPKYELYSEAELVKKYNGTKGGAFPHLPPVCA